ncbi:hypothetical protein AB9F26_17185 [Falsihalocynthiibacter sp. BN13B15]|uniref:hypothetical protein n=1 Tax=Falsihalocynthiibacter sp. BN13B15 TaxID=3240871 RepID=UPI00350FA9AA
MDNPKCPLDDFFGDLLEAAGKVGEFERLMRPASLTELSDVSAGSLLKYMNAATDGLRIAQVAHEMLPILWVLDGQGRIHLALEEVYEDTVGGRKFPLARGIQVPTGYYKLGHPSLIECETKKARIGGEILYDPDPEYGVDGWVITNSSGRFGYGSHRVEKHLQNVADAFSAYGITVDVYYIPSVS